MDELEREVRAMLRKKAAGMPDEYDASEEFTARVSRRKNAKRAGVAGALVAVVVVAGLVAVSSTAGGSHRTVIATPTVPTGACRVAISRGEPTAPIGPVTEAVPGLDRNAATKLAMYSSGDVDELHAVLGPRGNECVTKRGGAALDNVAVLSASDAETYRKSADIVWGGEGVNVEVLYDGADSGCPPVANVTPQCATVFTDESRVAANAWVRRMDGMLTAARVTQPSRATSGTVTTALLRCQLPDQALCEPIINDYIRRNPPQAAPVTSTTTSTTTTVPATSTSTSTTSTSAPPVATVAGQGCGMTSVIPSDQFAAGTVPSRVLPGVAPAVAQQLRSFASSKPPLYARLTALGPAGWHCYAVESNTGTELYVYPPAADASFGPGNTFASSDAYKGPVVKVFDSSFGTGSGINGACAVFADLALIKDNATFPAQCVVPPGRVATKVGPGAYSFTDANGARGIGTYDLTHTNPIDGSYSYLTCNLGAQSSLCNTIIADYLARNPGHAPS